MAIASAFIVAVSAGAASSAEIHVIAPNALKPAYQQIVPAYENSSHDTVVISWRPAVRMLHRLSVPEKADLVIVPADAVDDLIAKGLLAPGTRSDLAKSLIGVAIRRGAPRPDLTSGATLKSSLLASKSIVLSGGTSSFYLLDLFRKMGIAGDIAPRMKQYGPNTGFGVAAVLARGGGDIGFTQVPEILGVPGVEYIGPLPPDVQQATVFSAGLFRSAEKPSAKALVKFLLSPQFVPILRKYGLEPG
jgi:molybdate transport system substrate-binding protein